MFQKGPGFIHTNSCNESKDILCKGPLLKSFRNISIQGVTFQNNTDSFSSWFFFHKIKILKLVNFFKWDILNTDAKYLPKNFTDFLGNCISWNHPCLIGKSFLKGKIFYFTFKFLVVLAVNPSTWETEVGGCWSQWVVQGM